MKKKVFLYAYDRVNLGDDLFIRTIVNRYPNISFCFWSSDDNKAKFSCLKNLKVLDPDSSWINFLKKLRPSLAARYKNRIEARCDAVVYIGGSLFIEYKNWQQINTWWEYEVKNRNFYVLGANFGPYHTEAYRESISKIFANMKDVCLRDRYSRYLFSDIETVRYAPDILFSYPIMEMPSEEKQIFVSVIDCELKDEGENRLCAYEQSYIETMVCMLNGFIERGYKVILSSFCKAEGDENAVETISSKLQAGMIAIVNYDGMNYQEILDKISGSSFVVASRFHAAILGFASNKPVLPIIYSDKTKHVLEDVGFKGKYLDIRHLEQIDIDLLLENCDDQKLANIGELKSQSLSHFIKLDQVLRKE